MTLPGVELEQTSILPGSLVHKDSKFLTIHSKTMSGQTVEVAVGLVEQPPQVPAGLPLLELAVPPLRELQQMAQYR